jgi:hypothetical protein
MRAAILAMLILLLPAALFAGPTMGVYFGYTPSQMTYSPMPFEQFNAYIFGHGSACYLTGAEFQVALPPGIVQISVAYPVGSLNLGDPANGVAISYWPPMDGWNPGYNLLCTVTLLATNSCPATGGTLQDAPVVILPNPGSGRIDGSCFPENNLFDFTGLTSIICPLQIGTQEKSWGAIKSLF